MKVGIAGLGRMGAGIAANIIRAGHDVTVWNRSQDALQPIVELGARPAHAIEEIVQGDLLISMLADDKAFKDVGLDGPVLRDAPRSLIHLNTATISLEFARSLAKTHADMGIAYVAATVFGRADIAAAGTLTVVVGGPKAAVDAADPVLKALGRNVFFVGEAPENANLVKLAGNLMLAAVIESFGEALALVRKAGIDPATFYQVMTQDLFAAPAFRNYGRIIVEQEYEPPGFLLRLGLKDQTIILDAGTELNVPLPLASLARDRLLTAMAKGYGEKDWVAFAEMIAGDAGLPIQTVGSGSTRRRNVKGKMKSTDAEQLVSEAEDRRYAAVLEADVDVLQDLIHPAFLMMHSSGFADSKDSYIGNLRTGKLQYRRIDRSEQVVTVQDGTATVFNRLSMSVTLAGESREVEARTLSVWVRSGDAWQMLAINSGAAAPKEA